MTLISGFVDLDGNGVKTCLTEADATSKKACVSY
jgi:hypothetical protein